MDNQDHEYSQPSPQLDSMADYDDDADDVDSIYQFKASMHVMKALNNMRQNGEFCDLIIEMGNTKFQVHQTVMVLWSPVLKNLLQTHEGSKQHVNIYYDKPDVFRNVLSFVYTGVFEDEILNIPGILMLAATFQIQLLQDLCVEHLKSIATAENVISLYHLAVKYRLPVLKLHCVDVMRRHLPEVAQTQELRNLSPPQIKFLLDSELVSRLDPEMKLCLIISWLTEDVSGRQKFLVFLLSYIDWSVAAENFLEDIRETESIFISSPECLYQLLESIHASSVSLGPYEDQYNTLRERYSNFPKSLVRVAIGSLQIDQFKPVGFCLVSNSKERVSHCKERVSHCKERGMSLKDYEEKIRREYGQGLSCNKDSSKVKVRKDKDSSKVKVRKDSQFSSEKKKLSTADKTSQRQGIHEGGSEADAEDEDIGQPATESGQPATESGQPATESGQPATESKSESKDKATIASKKSSSEKKPRSHKKKINIDELELLQCEYCNYTSYKRNLLADHQKRVHKEKCIYCCDMCPFKSKWIKEYYTHMKENHFKKGPPFVCNAVGCDFSDAAFSNVVTHRRKHNVKPFACEICLNTFRLRSTLRSHLTSHSDERKFECPTCHKLFKWKASLDKHLNTHSDLRPFLCDVCGFSTKHKNHLTSHKRIHSGRVFRCQVPNCGYYTPRKTLMTEHNLNHAGIRQHICKTCGIAFVLKSHLARHEQIHTGEKPHACTVCDYRSLRRYKLIQHYKKHHPGEIHRMPRPYAQPRNKHTMETENTVVIDNHDIRELTTQCDALIVQSPGMQMERGDTRDQADASLLLQLQQQTYLLESASGNDR